MKKIKPTMEQERITTLHKTLHQMHPFDSYAIVCTYLECMLYHSDFIASGKTIEIKTPWLLSLLSNSINRLCHIILQARTSGQTCDWPILGFSICYCDNKLECFSVCFPKFIVDYFGVSWTFEYFSGLKKCFGERRMEIMIEMSNNIRDIQ